MIPTCIVLAIAVLVRAQSPAATVRRCTANRDCPSQCCESSIRPIGRRLLQGSGTCKPRGRLGDSCLVSQSSTTDPSGTVNYCACEAGLQCNGNGQFDVPLGELGVCARALRCSAHTSTQYCARDGGLYPTSECCSYRDAFDGICPSDCRCTSHGTDRYCSSNGNMYATKECCQFNDAFDDVCPIPCKCSRHRTDGYCAKDGKLYHWQECCEFGDSFDGECPKYCDSNRPACRGLVQSALCALLVPGEPVCGSNGKGYANACEMKADTCGTSPPVVASPGSCGGCSRHLDCNGNQYCASCDTCGGTEQECARLCALRNGACKDRTLCATDHDSITRTCPITGACADDGSSCSGGMSLCMMESYCSPDSPDLCLSTCSYNCLTRELWTAHKSEFCCKTQNRGCNVQCPVGQTQCAGQCCGPSEYCASGNVIGPSVMFCVPDGVAIGRPFSVRSAEGSTEHLLSPLQRCGTSGNVSSEAVPACDWTDIQPQSDGGVDSLSLETRQRISDKWAHAALGEHASVASFARFSLQLMAVGATPELLRGAHTAAAQEVTHAQLAFSLAHAYSPNTAPPKPGPFPLPVSLFDQSSSSPLASLASATASEGCIDETIAALVAAARGNLVSSPDHAGQLIGEVEHALSTIARDEAQHAVLAWRTVVWALAQASAHDEGVRVATADAFALALGRYVDDREAGSGTEDQDSALPASHGFLAKAQDVDLRRLLARQVLSPWAAAVLAGKVPQEDVDVYTRVPVGVAQALATIFAGAFGG